MPEDAVEGGFGETGCKRCLVCPSTDSVRAQRLPAAAGRADRGRGDHRQQSSPGTTANCCGRLGFCLRRR